jgi:hypothetical protein
LTYQLVDYIDAHHDPDIPDQYYVDWNPGMMNYQGTDFGDEEVWDDPGSVAPSGGWEDGIDIGEDGEGEDDGYGDDDDVDPYVALYIKLQMLIFLL